MMKNVGVIGLGTMGAGIVEVFAKAGIAVQAVDGSDELAARGRGFLKKSLGRALAKGKLSQQDHDAILGRVSFGSDLASMKDVDLVIEAIPERLDLKTKIFTQLDGIVSERCVLATNTSSLSITEIAASTAHPERVIGMHFFNPAPVLALVEVIYGGKTDKKLVDEVRELAEAVGKKPVVVGDRAGFVANALLIAYTARAIRHYENRLASRADLDAAISVGVGLPMGPLTLCDLIGLDVVAHVCEVLFDATRDPSVATPSLLKQKVAAGDLGRKTGRGFYTYDAPGSGKVVDDEETESAPAAFSGSVALVGVGELIDELGERIEKSGLSVKRVRDASDVDALKGLSLALAIDDDGEAGETGCCVGSCACGDDEAPASRDDEAHGTQSHVEIGDKPLMRQVREKLGKSGVVAVLGQAGAAAAATGDVAMDAGIVPVVLHEPTKAGQVLEIGRSVAIREDATALVRSFAAAAGFTPVVGKDRAGMVVDALLYPHMNDAIAMLDSGYATVDDIDTAMKAGCGYPFGPFELIDDIGMPELFEGLSEMHDETGEQHLVPSPLLADYIMAQRSFRG